MEQKLDYRLDLPLVLQSWLMLDLALGHWLDLDITSTNEVNTKVHTNCESI